MSGETVSTEADLPGATSVIGMSGTDGADNTQAVAGATAQERPVIQVLSDRVIDQIAAGEVVERPASVVKELVENALDAGARQITVEVENGGKTLVRVTDDGCGMAPADVALALTRHATSKLRDVDELFGIGTMGFRGEAMPSIASVSKMSVRTRTRDHVAGTLVRIEGGRRISSEEVGAPVGTQIEVRDLLYNVPARQKFMKGHATEASHISDAVTKLALAHPAVHITLMHGARTAVSAPPHSSRLERARAVLGSRHARRLHQVCGQENGVRIEALLTAPELAQSTSRGVQLFVGRRSIRDRGLLHAVKMGYGELVRPGRYPVCVVFIDAPGGEVDINVHPQKLEVRFSDAQVVYAALRHVIARGISSAPWLADRAELGSSPVRMRAIASTVPPGPLAPGSRVSDTASDYIARRGPDLWGQAKARARGMAPRAAEAGDGNLDPGQMHQRAASAPESASVGSEPTVPPGLPGLHGPSGLPVPPGTEALEPAADHQAELPVQGEFFSSLTYLGQLDRTYLLCESDGELVLIDQHAAHERVAFQRLRDRYRERELPVQRLLFPKNIELDEAGAALVGEAQEQLAAVGFELEPFGGTTFALKAVPAGLRQADPEKVLEELLGELADRGGSRAVSERLDLVLATIACHSVVRAGDALSAREVEALLASMDQVDFNAHCPHGRPVLLRISVAEIARRFGR